MVRCVRAGSVAVVLAIAAPSVARAQATTPYHLHKETSLVNSANRQLTTGSPDASKTALQTANLKNISGNAAFPIANFETQSGVPNRAGTIAAGSVVSFDVYMRVTRLPASGSIYPYVVLRLNSSTGTVLCVRGSQDGLPALTTTLTLYSFTCTTAAAVTMTASDRFFLQVSVWVAGTTGNQNLFGELDVETSADSKVTIPNPAANITSLSASSGIVGDVVTINGTDFGSSGTVTFNGTAASTSNWTSTAIQASVPSGVAVGPGPVVVSVGGVPSNGVTFTALPHITDINPAGAAIGESVAISGTTFGATTGTVTFNNGVPATTISGWSNTSISVAVPSGATTGPVVVSAGGNASAGFAFTVITTGTVTGTITRVTGAAALAGATVQAVLVGIVKGTAASAANGTYSIPNLDSGTYDVRVSAAGFSSEVRSGTTVSANATTTVNVAMSAPGVITGRVTQADGTTPIAGAAVSAYAGPVQQGAASTNGTGDYSISGLHTGSYTVRAVNAGNRTKEQGASVAEGGITTSNFTLDAAASGPVLYAYDGLGRLIQVTDQSGDAAFYHYDAVGNITAIDRYGSTNAAISGVTPSSGAAGTAVSIYGIGFGASQGTSAVTINGATATPTTWSSTAIATTVPGGAAPTGVIVVTVNGLSSNGVAFSVTAAATGPPTITGFAPTLVAAGDALTVAGTNFETMSANDNLRLNTAFTAVSSATPTAMQATVPATATTGPVSLTTPGGAAEGASYLWVAPPPYGASNVDSTAVVTFGAATPVSVPADASSAKIALWAFDGSNGHRAAINVTGVSGGAASVYLYGPGGGILQKAQSILSSGFLDTTLLRTTSTYTVVFDPQSANATTATLTVYDVPSDFTSAIAFGTSLQVPTTAVGQNAKLTFAGSSGHRVSLDQAGFNCFTSHTSILAPDGEILANAVCGGTFIDPVALTTSGTYTIVVNPDGANTGSPTLTLYDVPTDPTGTLTINDQSTTSVALGTPGQNGAYTFNGTNFQPVTVHVTNNTVGGTFPCVTVSLLRQSGSTITSNTSCGSSFNLSQQTLPATETYTVKVDPAGNSTGTLNLQVTSP